MAEPFDRESLLEAIAEQAAVVRQRQRAYFTTRAQSALVASKEAEAVLDKLLAKLNPPAPPRQGSLL